MRRARETNWPYRLVEESDLVAGAEFIMVDTGDEPTSNNARSFDSTVDPACIGTTIRLDNPPVRVDEKTFSNPPRDVRYVFYHCVKPPWEQQCYVPLGYFLGQIKDRTKYWIAID